MIEFLSKHCDFISLIFMLGAGYKGLVDKEEQNEYI